MGTGGYQLGVDLGTTYTGAAVRRDGVSEIVTLGTRSATMPTVVVAMPDGTLLVGEAAERRALEHPERTARQFKRRLGDTTPILLGGTPYSPQALLAAVLADVVARVTEEQGGPPERVCLTHPANWGPYKRELVRQIAELAGLGVDQVATITEPAAAALHYASQAHLEPGSTVAVYDLGGGTFDAAIVRVDVGGAEILGEPNGIEHLGGIDFDAVVFDHVARELGPRVAPILDGDAEDQPSLWRLREECSRAKEALSSDSDAVVGVALPDGLAEVRITRGEFESMVRPALAPTALSMRRAVESAGIVADDLAGVLLVGGSSRIPLVSEIVGSELGRPVLLDAHPKHAVALGAAAHAAGAEVGAVVEVIGGEIDLAAAAPRPRWLAPVVAALVVLLAAVGGLIGLLVTQDNDPELIESIDDPNSTTTTELETTTTSSSSSTTTTTSTTTTAPPIDVGTTAPPRATTQTTVVFDIPEATPTPTTTVTPTPPPAVVPPNVVVPGQVTAALVRDPIDNGSPATQPSSLQVTLTWNATTSTGNGTVGYRVYRQPMSGASPAGNRTLVHEGAGTSAVVTVPDFGAVSGWVRWEVVAFNEAGEGTSVEPQAVVPYLIELHQWRAFSRVMAIGLQVGYSPQFGCLQDNLVCDTAPDADQVLPLNSLLTVVYDE